jgi:uroporphyrinogen-III synthase
MHAELPLQGLTLVVTRPRVQAARTAATLRQAGATVIEFPVLDITPIDAAIAPRVLSGASGIIFVSANAVEYGLPVIAHAGKIKSTTQLFAIGRATAGALADAGHADVVSPQQTIDSEGLLAMPQLQSVMGRHIILVKGASESGGRTLLEETLAARGARVMVLVCYRRGTVVPGLSAKNALQNSFAQGNHHACFALSAETLDSLVTVFSSMNIPAKSEIALLVPNVRVGDAARAHGFSRIAEVPLAESALVPALSALKPQLLNHAPLTY